MHHPQASHLLMNFHPGYSRHHYLQQLTDHPVLPHHRDITLHQDTPLHQYIPHRRVYQHHRFHGYYFLF